MAELAAIRNVFPDWPSELDVVKNPAIWMQMAQEFYSAYVVLREEREKYSNGGEIITDAVFRRLHTVIPASFCLAFSIELSIKSVLIRQGALATLTSDSKLPFASHSLVDLARGIQSLNLTASEIEQLNLAATIINAGKYPSPTKPSDSKSGVSRAIGVAAMESVLAPLYDRLQKLST